MTAPGGSDSSSMVMFGFSGDAIADADPPSGSAIGGGGGVGERASGQQQRATVTLVAATGDDLERYRTSPHKDRMDSVASSLVRLRYANEVIRQHLHEWLRFSGHLVAKEGSSLPNPNAEIVRQYVARRTAGCSARNLPSSFA